MDTILTSDILFAITGIFLIPSLIVLTYIKLSEIGVFWSYSELCSRKEKLKTDVPNFLKRLNFSIGSRYDQPNINWKHISGPMLYTSASSFIWITLWERFLLWSKMITIDHLNIKYCNDEIFRRGLWAEK